MNPNKKKTAIIIGAGPAGLTAAYELLQHTNIKPIVFEMTSDLGGISKTVNYKGNRIDIGGHRFFSKSTRVMEWWANILPPQQSNESEVNISYQNAHRPLKLNEHGPNPDSEDKVMLVRNRLSRIYFLRKFFSYPISLSVETLANLGIFRSITIGISYFRSIAFPIREEKTLEDFLINRFGHQLYNTFFKDYTEKVWGVPCNQISAEWGAQRIKGLSITKAILHAITSKFKSASDIHQKKTETSLIEKFLYPKYGPGQVWEEVTRLIESKGGEVIKNKRVTNLKLENNAITEVIVQDTVTSEATTITGDYFFSTMPIKELIKALGNPVPDEVKSISEGLMYRDFITVGLLLNKLKIENKTSYKTHNNVVPDNWIYIQERDVKIGRLQIFNNWSPYMVKDPDTVWIGLEYFCNEGDELWQMPDNDFIQFAIKELSKIDIIEEKEVLDHTIIRMPKAYPAYFGTYNQLPVVRKFTDNIPNLFLIGRNGMHKYNNQDHSMLTAITAVENIIHGVHSKDNLWSINTEEDYHEQKS
jgi:protoporphyrinogen oxidase